MRTLSEFVEIVDKEVKNLGIQIDGPNVVFKSGMIEYCIKREDIIYTIGFINNYQEKTEVELLITVQEAFKPFM